MAIVECGNGHLYNTDQYASCPYCGGSINRVEFGYGGDSNIGKTAPAGGFGGPDFGAPQPSFGGQPDFGYGGQVYGAPDNYGATVAPSGYNPGASPSITPVNEELGSTVAPASYQAAAKKEEPKEDEDTGKTVAVLRKNLSIDPIAGWLVCIEGSDKGKDYRIMAKNNSIGRSEKMDICIKGDATISRENHARIAYDLKHNAFHLIPADSTNGIYVNGEPVYVPTVLNAFDELEFGESKFMFVPFCSDKFQWQKEEK